MTKYEGGPGPFVEAEAQKIIVDCFDQVQKLEDTKSVPELEDEVLKFDSRLLSTKSSPSGIYSPAPFSEDAADAGMQEELEKSQRSMWKWTSPKKRSLESRVLFESAVPQEAILVNAECAETFGVRTAASELLEERRAEAKFPNASPKKLNL